MNTANVTPEYHYRCLLFRGLILAYIGLYSLDCYGVMLYRGYCGVLVNIGVIVFIILFIYVMLYRGYSLGL